ncbi:Deoxyuridine 5'-triphosphate nucleotidohydrolase (EC 3.6.1.23) [Azospirillum argentinense]|uniref:dUTP diphosphatase n=1 Tax=Azospirillum argentinense TaxID=2970906 RepID=UPI0032DFF541
MRVPVLYLDHFNPEWGDLGHARPGDAGVDLVAALPMAMELRPGVRALVKTGVAMAIPEGYELQIRPRSGLALKHGVTVLNTPGTIDAGYRGEIGVILINHLAEPFVVEPGMRVAQGVLARFEPVEFETVAVLPTSERGAAGFGSTGS